MRKNLFYLFGVFFASFCFWFPNFSFADSNNITGIIFVTEQRSVKTGEVSEPITVQTINSSGLSEKVSETNDVLFTSTSSTGEFLNSSGNAVSTTMAKNTSSRTFYYRDLSEGTHTITVSIKGRESGATFFVSQQIVVGDNVSNVEDDDEEVSDTDSSSSNTNSSSQSVSSHSSNTSLSNVSEVLELKVDAGRKRLSIINSPIQFSARINDYKNNKRLTYEWSFGDGTSGRGKQVEHTYQFPGKYNVVLNVEGKDVTAVSRTEVIVENPDIKISQGHINNKKFVEINNDSNFEINFQGFKLDNGKRYLIISRDTIIDKKSSIKIPFDFDESDSVSLYYPNSEKAFDAKVETLAKRDAQISEIQNKIVALKAEISKQAEIENPEFSEKISDLPSDNFPEDKKEFSTTSFEKIKEPQKEILIEELDEVEEKGFVENLFAKPKRLFDIIIGR